MTILYVFPHPDDESFGPARAMAHQLRAGHEVHLLTLTRGGATKQRFELGLSVDEMGDVRYREMLDVERTLGLSGMRVLDLPDSGLKEMDPRAIESVVAEEIERLRPDIVVSYNVDGVSGFHDHLVTHAVVKRVYCELRERIPNLRRLAFFTLTKEQAEQGKKFQLRGSPAEMIDVLLHVTEPDVEANRRALACYVTYGSTIEASGVLDLLDEPVAFELFQEAFDEPLAEITENLS